MNSPILVIDAGKQSIEHIRVQTALPLLLQDVLRTSGHRTHTKPSTKPPCTTPRPIEKPLMSLNRFFHSPIRTGPIELSAGDPHHALHVRRLQPGDPVELFDGTGTLATGRVSNVHSRRIIVEVQHVDVIGPPTGGELILAVSLAKGDRFDWMVSKAVELGVDRLCPVRFSRTVKQATGANVVQRYERLALAAAKQCHRLFLPQIDSPADLTDVLDRLHNDYPNVLALFGAATSEAPSLTMIQPEWRDILAFVGPEGGFSAEEEALLLERSAQPVMLTDTILRTETAALAFAAVLATRRAAVRTTASGSDK